MSKNTARFLVRFSVSLAVLAFLASTSGCPDDTTTPSDVGVTNDTAPVTDTATQSGDDLTTDAAAGTPSDGQPDASSTGETQFPWAPESLACEDGEDNDGNTFTDCNDFACARNLAVTVCGSNARYEASPADCGNGRDDDGDSLTDCQDPDCYSNPFHDVCAVAAPESDCANTTDDDGDSAADCEDFDCLLADGTTCDRAGRLAILFDQVIDETSAGGPNSDWVIDGWERWPVPSNPSGPDDWDGGLSSLGFALHTRGHLLETLPSHSGRLSHGDTTNPQDLSIYDVVAVFEPSRQMSADEKTALLRYVEAGGGLLLVANHLGADRDGNNFSAPQVLNDFLFDNPVANDPFGVRFDEIDAETRDPLDDIRSASHPIIVGAAGAASTVTQIGFFDGCTARLTGTNANAEALIGFDATSAADEDIVVGVSTYGAGRMVFITDSAIAGDGTSSHGTIRSDHDSWNDDRFDHPALFVNAVLWLGGM